MRALSSKGWLPDESPIRTAHIQHINHVPIWRRLATVGHCTRLATSRLLGIGAVAQPVCHHDGQAMSPEILNQEQMLTHVRAQIKARYGAIKTAAYELDINPDHLSKMVRGVRPMSGLCWQRAGLER
jgi:hypothetical protein